MADRKPSSERLSPKATSDPGSSIPENTSDHNDALPHMNAPPERRQAWKPRSTLNPAANMFFYSGDGFRAPVQNTGASDSAVPIGGMVKQIENLQEETKSAIQDLWDGNVETHRLDADGNKVSMKGVEAESGANCLGDEPEEVKELMAEAFWKLLGIEPPLNRTVEDMDVWRAYGVGLTPLPTDGDYRPVTETPEEALWIEEYFTKSETSSEAPSTKSGESSKDRMTPRLRMLIAARISKNRAKKLKLWKEHYGDAEEPSDMELMLFNPSPDLNNRDRTEEPADPAVFDSGRADGWTDDGIQSEKYSSPSEGGTSSLGRRPSTPGGGLQGDGSSEQVGSDEEKPVGLGLRFPLPSESSEPFNSRVPLPLPGFDMDKLHDKLFKARRRYEELVDEVGNNDNENDEDENDDKPAPKEYSLASQNLSGVSSPPTKYRCGGCGELVDPGLDSTICDGNVERGGGDDLVDRKCSVPYHLTCAGLKTQPDEWFCPDCAKKVDEEPEEEFSPALNSRGTCRACGRAFENKPVLCVGSLCDSERCDKPYHLECLGLTEYPVKDWFCYECKLRNEKECSPGGTCRACGNTVEYGIWCRATKGGRRCGALYHPDCLGTMGSLSLDWHCLQCDRGSKMNAKNLRYYIRRLQNRSRSHGHPSKAVSSKIPRQYDQFFVNGRARKLALTIWRAINNLNSASPLKTYLQKSFQNLGQPDPDRGIFAYHKELENEKAATLRIITAMISSWTSVYISSPSSDFHYYLYLLQKLDQEEDTDTKRRILTEIRQSEKGIEWPGDRSEVRIKILDSLTQKKSTEFELEIVDTLLFMILEREVRRTIEISVDDSSRQDQPRQTDTGPSWWDNEIRSLIQNYLGQEIRDDQDFNIGLQLQAEVDNIIENMEHDWILVDKIAPSKLFDDLHIILDIAEKDEVLALKLKEEHISRERKALGIMMARWYLGRKENGEVQNSKSNSTDGGILGDIGDDGDEEDNNSDDDDVGALNPEDEGEKYFRSGTSYYNADNKDWDIKVEDLIPFDTDPATGNITWTDARQLARQTQAHEHEMAYLAKIAQRARRNPRHEKNWHRDAEERKEQERKDFEDDTKDLPEWDTDLYGDPIWSDEKHIARMNKIMENTKARLERAREKALNRTYDYDDMHMQRLEDNPGRDPFNPPTHEQKQLNRLIERQFRKWMTDIGVPEVILPCKTCGTDVPGVELRMVPTEETLILMKDEKDRLDKVETYTGSD